MLVEGRTIAIPLVKDYPVRLPSREKYVEDFAACLALE
jgi:hypothetical protein